MSDQRAESFRQPAEWTPHAACWVAWPSAEELWLENLAPAQISFVAMCEAIADVDPVSKRPRGERLEVLVPYAAREREALESLRRLGARVHRVPFGDIWLRDTAPIFVTTPSGVRASACFAFNGWGGKYVLEHDDKVASRIAAIAGSKTLTFPWVLEGGSVEVDGEGTCLTTRQCLLNANRNPTMNEAALERALGEALGVTKVLWLEAGLTNDHTDGHVDTIARFVRPGVVVCMEPSGDDDPSKDALLAIAKDLAEMTDARGKKLEVVRIPSPGRIVGDDGSVMPASYVNFFIANRAVVVPTYGSPWDDDAVLGIKALFPGRRTVGVPAKELLSGGGAFHCITQQEPRASREVGR